MVASLVGNTFLALTLGVLYDQFIAGGETASGMALPSTTVIVLLLLIATCASSALVYFVYEYQAAALSEASKTIHRAETEKDLTLRVRDGHNGHLNRLTSGINSLLGSISGMLSQARALSGRVSQANQVVSDSAQAVAENTEHQSNSVEELAASVEETASMVHANAHSAGAANELARRTAAVATDGQTQVTNMVNAMEEIDKSSRSIMQIIKAIDEIAFQTNLLALNAAVEAARAGEHGRGFAVVAAEVRNLAARSSKAAGETSRLIEAARAQVEVGVATSDETRATFETIANGIAEVADRINEITLAGTEQTRAVDQINHAMGEIEHIMRMNRDRAEELARTSDEMRLATGELDSCLGTYSLG